MRKKFLKGLTRGLMALSKKERDRYLSSYEEILLDKKESGITEEIAVKELGDIKLISNDILNAYINMHSKADNMKYINKIILILDIIVLFSSYYLAYFLYLQCNLSIIPHLAPFSLYKSVTLIIIPIYFILYYFYKLFTIRYIKHLYLGIRNIIFANIVGMIICFFLLFLLQEFLISRIFLIMFTIVNAILEIIIRVILNYYITTLE